MVKHKKYREKLGRVERRRIVAKMYLAGNIQAVIADKVGVTQKTVSTDLKQIREEWIQSTLFDFDELMGKELARLDNLEATYWQAWEDSKKNVTIVKKEGKGSKGKYEETATKTDPSTGDAKFLDGVHKVQQERRKLLSLYPNLRPEEEDPDKDKKDTGAILYYPSEAKPIKTIDMSYEDAEIIEDDPPKP